ncbi:DNA phosphorothioation-dependent restriction protein DptF [Oceanobacillus luteolus]|uniref:DNA phosphorothioation-dependent restriction protein DptF n=1 Tax=Oceanobacillus luteolus TaxID=1274358 RepID=UPI0020413D7F|nr:DNA phosphorothioation-dependent restriction protein DptF [Oceanobacillus luteolus]MCM3741909.1 DNA phosphorothioation-dependent restriction protein DptF [Oceanobacillus luteolus]
MSKFVEFLKTMNTTAAQYVHEMEQIIFKDPSSAIVKGRKFLEVILNDITKYEDLDEAYPTFSLYEKISYLIRDHIIDGRKIQKSFDTVRIIGNKAAHHSETNEYADAFKVHRELYNIAIWYHDLYFYTDNNSIIPLYESPQPQQQPQGDYQEIQRLMNEVKNFLGSKVTKDIEIEQPENRVEKKAKVNYGVSLSDRIEAGRKNQDTSIEIKENKPDLFNKDLPKGESYLIRELNRLKTSSKEAVENANQFSPFKDYLHVERPILRDLERMLEENANKEHGNLILLCGNVGDGKSHILAYLNKNRPELVKNYEIYNDATESFSPNKDALATLEESLSGFSDQNLDSHKGNFILAINMGVLHNFISRKHEKYTYNRLIEFINESELFSPKIQPNFTKDNFSLLSFGDYNSYELTNRGPVSSFYSALLKKIVDPLDRNPFYLAFQEDKKNELHTIIHDNYKLLQNDSVQEAIIQLVIESVIKDKLVISARAFLNLIADILIPNNYEGNSYLSDLEKLESTLPNLLFGHSERSDILRSISKMDPIHRRSEITDQLVIELNTLTEWESVVNNNVEDEVAIGWLSPFFNQDTLTGYSFDLFFETFVRIIYLLNKEYAESIKDDSYKKYIDYLYYFNKGNKAKVRTFYEEFKKVMLAWRGSPKKEYIYINKPSEKYRIAQELFLRPTIEHIESNPNEVLQSFKTTILLAYEDRRNKNKVTIDIDYPLFKLLSKVKNGYLPNKTDDENAIQFTEFVDKAMKFGDEKKELLVYLKTDNRLYSFRKGDFGSYVFERESNYSG